MCKKNERNNVRTCNAVAMLLAAVYIFLKDTAIYNGNALVMAATDFAQGLTIGLMFVGLIMSSRYGVKIREIKQRIIKK